MKTSRSKINPNKRTRHDGGGRHGEVVGLLNNSRWPPLVVGLTGGIGSGKSTVAAWLKKRGVPVLDADAVVHRALQVGGRGYKATFKLFGPSVRRKDGSLDRAVMASLVFERPSLRKKLEGILHPIVEREFRRRISAHRRGLLVLEVPLLFETGMDRWVDRTVLVWAPKKFCLSRLVASGRLTRAQAMARMAAQMALSEKRRRAHFLLFNNVTRATLLRNVRHLFAGPGGATLPLVYKNVTTS
ncbi:MAG: dephospho-CoA kinase [Elusimicrobia bacterium]|nr:dephospho-CoA kinase [Elusimicrobiota bacterium]